ncbi:hypothetical protein BX600DRAFT_446160 [Xylariales sp. PMI_506]|nr:hypothetical protein BX600DRAFT_446160 [Xylariales sp. PMI_506]
MSASPSGGLNGQTPPPGKGLVARRKPKAINALRPRQKPQSRPAGVHAPGTPLPASSKGLPPKASVRPEVKTAVRSQPNFEALRQQNGGWSTPPVEGMVEWDLVLTRKSTKDGMRSHIMKMVPHNQRAAQQGIDPSDQDQFTRPVLLHRRDPRQPPPGRVVKEPTPDFTPEQTAETERLKQLKAERDAQRAIDDAQKAPTGAPAKKQPKQKEKPQGTKVNHGPRTEQQKKESEIRYEEALPWHLEDADGKNVWVGQYEAPLSDTKVGIVVKDGRFNIIPLEKWYKFSSKRASVNAMSIEEAERTMGRKAPPSRWAMRDAQREQVEKAMAESRNIVNGRTAVKQESQTYKRASRREKEEHDDIDMSGDEFQDDDEAAGFEPDRDEDAKESENKIRRDQLGANLFGDADEQTIEKEEAQRLKEELERKLFGKDMKKSLKRRDKQFQYDDSDDSERERDPFASSSDDDSDTESEDENKQEEDKDSKDKATGTSSKGTNTPQGKKSEAAKKGKSLKRPGSPMVSDSSGTESTRKAKKKKTGPSTTSLNESRGSTPLPPSRRPGAGSGSDAEATGGEMSDGAGGKKKKKRTGTLLGTGTGAKGTPVGSRTGSPAPAAAAVPITSQEIIDALPEDPANGLSIASLLTIFQSRVGDNPGQMPKKQWFALVKSLSVWRQETKTLSRKKTTA